MKIEKLIAVAKELNELLFEPGEACIPTKNVTEEDLTETIIEAADELREDDEVSDETIRILIKLDAWKFEAPEETLEELEEEVKSAPKSKPKPKPAPKKVVVEEEDDEEEDEEEEVPIAKPATKSKPAPKKVVEEEDEDEDEEDVKPAKKEKQVDRATALIKEIKATQFLSKTKKEESLKEIIKNNSDVFKALVASVDKKVDLTALKNTMLEILVNKTEKSDEEVDVPRVKPTPKGTKLKVVKEKKEKVVKEKKPKPASRLFVMAQVLRDNPKLGEKELVEKADAIYAKGANKELNFKEQRADYFRVLQVFEALGL